ncbi:hypothetical protein D3C72_2138780 [compost metagenome]
MGLVAEPADGVEEPQLAREAVEGLAHGAVSEDGQGERVGMLGQDLGDGLEGLGDAFLLAKGRRDQDAAAGRGCPGREGDGLDVDAEVLDLDLGGRAADGR